MKKLILLFVVFNSLCFISITSCAQAPNWLWAKSAGGSSQDEARSIAVDASGNTYIVGYFGSATITFGSTTLTNAGPMDIFLTKYDPNGNVVWAKRAGGTTSDEAYSVAVDTSGNVFVAGIFHSTTIIFGSTTLTNAGNYDIFLAKYDSNGNVLWAKRAGGAGLDRAYSVTVDVSGNAYLAGYFASSSIVFGSTTLTSVGAEDIFLAKYGVNGNVLWAKSAGSALYDGATSVAVDTSGNVYMAGVFRSSTIVFGSTTLTNAGVSNYDIFLAKYDINGNIVWAKSAGSTSDDVATSVTVDLLGNLYVTGYFKSPSLIFGSTTLSNADNTGNSYDLFISKYDINGNVVWAKSAGSTGDDFVNSIALDALGNPYVTGYFNSSTLSFGSTTLTNVGSNNIFLAKYDVNGNVVWAKSSGGTDNDFASSVVVDPSGNVCVSGYFNSPSITFNSTTLTNAGVYNIFIAKCFGCYTPANAGSVSGFTTVCQGQNSVIYTVPIINYATSYIWTLPSGATGSSTSNSISVDYGISAVSGNITVKGNNTCGNGATSTIAITVNPAYSFTENHSICDGDTYNWHGANYITAGTFTANYTSISGCDSIYTLHLTVNPVYAFTENHSICNGDTYNWHGTDYSIAGNYYDSLNTVMGCDSVYALNLSVFSVNTSLTVSDPTITANASGATYQWLDCDNAFAIIPGATSQSFTAIANGYYAVMITQGLCSDTSACVQITTVGIASVQSGEIIIYPNPATDKLYIEVPKKSDIEISNIQGQQIKSIAASDNTTTIDISTFAKGMYFVKVKTENGIAVKKFIKQ
jgi:hypothetical protein